MSRDFFVFSKLTIESTNADGKAQFDDGFSPVNIGSRTEVKQQITKVLPSVAWRDDFVGVLETASGAIEIHLSGEEMVSNFMISSWGNVSFEIDLIMQETNWKVIDTATGQWVKSKEDVSLGEAQFQEFLERALGDDVEH